MNESADLRAVKIVKWTAAMVKAVCKGEEKNGIY